MHLKRKILIVTFFVGFLFLFSINIRSSFAEVDPLQLQVPIPGAKGDSVSADGTIKFDNKTTAIAEYIKNIYNYAISIVGIVATIMLMFGGFTWLTAGGSGEKVGKARDIIFGSLTGLVLALTSYTILTLVNPDLVNLRIVEVAKPISKPPIVNNVIMGCCMHTNPSNTSLYDDCKSRVEKKNCVDPGWTLNQSDGFCNRVLNTTTGAVTYDCTGTH